jgi:ketosteroid isomerase-like protein
MTGRAVVESAVALWNNHDREGFIACFAEDCEFNVPRRPGKGRAAVAAWWDINHTAFSSGRVQAKVLIESGETVALEASSKRRTPARCPLSEAGGRSRPPAEHLCCRTRPCTPCVTG